MAQERRVLLANGQYITIVQTTGTSSGDVMSQSAVTAALNTKANVSHTHAASDITSGAFGTDRIADGAITLAKLGRDVPLSSAAYETVQVSAYTGDGIPPIGAEITIGGDLYRFDRTGVVFAQIPYEHVYKVQTRPNNVWIGGHDLTYTASTPSRFISINFIALDGVFIESTDGMLFTHQWWPPHATPNSIIVAGNGISFRMALTQAPSTMQIHGTAASLNEYIAAIPNSMMAANDYDGAGNAKKILLMQPSTSYAAGYCNAFTFPDGKTKGYLPSYGQLYLARQNKAAIDTALSTCGGTAMGTLYWTSTFLGSVYGEDSCYSCNWQEHSASNYGNLDDYYSVRPFGAYL